MLTIPLPSSTSYPKVQQLPFQSRFSSSNFQSSGFAELPTYENDDLDKKYRLAQALAANRSARGSTSTYRRNESAPHTSSVLDYHAGTSRMMNRSANEASLRDACLRGQRWESPIRLGFSSDSEEEYAEAVSLKRRALCDPARRQPKRTRINANRDAVSNNHDCHAVVVSKQQSQHQPKKRSPTQGRPRYRGDNDIGSNAGSAVSLAISDVIKTKSALPPHNRHTSPAASVRNAVMTPDVSREQAYVGVASQNGQHKTSHSMSGRQSNRFTSQTQLRDQHSSARSSDSAGMTDHIHRPNLQICSPRVLQSITSTPQNDFHPRELDSRLKRVSQGDRGLPRDQEDNRERLFNQWKDRSCPVDEIPQTSGQERDLLETYGTLHTHERPIPAYPPYSPSSGHRPARPQMTSLQQSCSPSNDGHRAQESNSADTGGTSSELAHQPQLKHNPNSKAIDPLTENSRDDQPRDLAQCNLVADESQLDHEQSLFVSEIETKSMQTQKFPTPLSAATENSGRLDAEKESGSQRKTNGVANNRTHPTADTTARTVPVMSPVDRPPSEQTTVLSIDSSSNHSRLLTTQSKAREIDKRQYEDGQAVKAPMANMGGTRSNFHGASKPVHASTYQSVTRETLNLQQSVPNETNDVLGVKKSMRFDGLDTENQQVCQSISEMPKGKTDNCEKVDLGMNEEDDGEPKSRVPAHGDEQTLDQEKPTRYGSGTKYNSHRAGPIAISKKTKALDPRRMDAAIAFKKKAANVFGHLDHHSDNSMPVNQVKQGLTATGHAPIPPEYVTQDDRDMMVLRLDQGRSWEDVFIEMRKKWTRPLTFQGMKRRGKRLELTFANGPPAPVTSRNPKNWPKLSENELDRLTACRNRHPNATYKELAEHWFKETGYRLSRRTMGNRMEMLVHKGKIKKASRSFMDVDERPVLEKAGSGEEHDGCGSSTDTATSDEDGDDENDARAVGRHFPHDRPVTGGKTIDSKYIEEWYGGIGDGGSLDDDRDEAICPWNAPSTIKWSQPRPIPERVTEEDICHYVYFVQQKLLGAVELQGDADDRPWINCSREIETLEEAKVKASQVFLDLRTTTFTEYSYKEFDRLPLFTGQNEYCKVMVRVSRQLRTHMEGIIPKSTRGMMVSRKDYVVKFSITYNSLASENDDHTDDGDAIAAKQTDELLWQSAEELPLPDFDKSMLGLRAGSEGEQDLDSLFKDLPGSIDNDTVNTGLAVNGAGDDKNKDRQCSNQIKPLAQAWCSCRFPSHTKSPQTLSNKHYAILDQANNMALRHVLSLRKKYLPQLASHRVDVVKQEEKEMRQLLRELEERDEPFILSFKGAMRMAGNDQEENDAPNVQIEVSAWVEEGEWVGPRN